MKLRLVLALLLGLIIFAGWKMASDDAAEKQQEYDTYISAARENARLKLYQKANDYYMAALSIRDTIELRCEIVDFMLENNFNDDALKQLQKMKDAYREDATPYEYLCKYAIDHDDIGSLYVYSKTMREYGLSSEKVDAWCAEHRFDYSLGKGEYYELRPFSSGMARYYTKSGYVGYLSLDGSRVIGATYVCGAPYTGTNYICVKDEEGETYFINTAGEKSLVDPQMREMVFDDIQGFGDQMMAVCENGKYRYINSAFDTVVPGKYYLWAGIFNQGRAAVQTETGWMLIDTAQTHIGSSNYEEIKVDENGFAVRNGVFFCKRNGSWYLTNLDGTEISSIGYEDVVLPTSETDAVFAVKKNGKWGFINTNGDEELPFIYEGARSFNNGAATVAVDGLWGIIDRTGNFVVQPTFLGAYDMNELNRVPVLTDRGWQILRFYSVE